jgi:hypothetical protein
MGIVLIMAMLEMMALLGHVQMQFGGGLVVAAIVMRLGEIWVQSLMKSLKGFVVSFMHRRMEVLVGTEQQAGRQIGPGSSADGSPSGHA